ncbi:MAG: glycosyltransferase family 39 protein [Deltaproteobacteria bacterium]|uniref:Glycosyltransferase family 39 protein n=1 Tax=Candidatus Zymogenus saltonus TaxID=2844893 RepID=A0A9D8PM28_9DELT|nr:glycosyltransferase family 39 protein [Candidatus Zymogenus saltonus]
MSVEIDSKPEKRYVLYLTAVIVTFAVVRILYIMYGPLNLVCDEAYFWDWSRKLDLSYYDQGSITAYIIAFTTALFGDTELGVRIGAVFFMAAATVVFYIAATDMFKSPGAGFAAALLFNLMPMSLAGGLIITYYSPMILFYPLMIYVLFKITEDKWGGALLWYIVGFLLGLGLLTHIMYWFYSFIVILYVMVSPGMRRWLKSPHFYLAALLAIVMSVPVLYWNWGHDFAMFRHAFGLGGVTKSREFSPLTFFEFLGGQIGILTPFVFVPFVYVYYLIIKRAFKDGVELYRLIFFTSAPIFILITLMSLRGRAEANWPTLGYIGPFMVFGAVIDDFLKTYRERKGRGLLRYGWFTLIFLIFLNVFAFNFDLIWKIAPKIFIEDPERDPTNGLRGWDILGKRVEEVYNEMGGEGKVFVFTQDYGETPELAFYMPSHPDATVLRYWKRKSQYDYWLKEGSPELTTGMDAIFVDRCRISSGCDEISNLIVESFERVDPPEELVIYKEGSEGKIKRRIFLVYRMYGFKGMNYDCPEYY